MITGPRMTERSHDRARLDHRPCLRSRDSASTVPSIRRSIVSRISRFASSMSSSLPVSFHQPSTRCGRTSRPRSIRSWIASVISSSLRKLGLIALHRLEDRRREHVDADQREIALRLLRLLDQPHDRAVAQLGDAEHLRIGHARQQDLRRRLLARRTPRRTCVIPLFSRLSPRYITNGSPPMNGSLISTACASPRGASCSM